MATKKIDNSCPVPNGILLVIGGHEDKGGGPETKGEKENYIDREIMKQLRELVTTKEPTIEIITTAGSESEETFSEYSKLLRRLGFSHIRHIHHQSREEVLNDPLIERIREADAFFFTGGDQLLLTSYYGGTDFLTEIKQRYIRDKIIIAGTSAGAMALSTPMIYAGNQEVQQITSEIKVTTGLEFLRDVCIDTHFVHRGRFIRMAQVIITNPACIGMGIEENTAFIIRNGTEVEVIGSGSVIVIEGLQISSSNTSSFTQKNAVSVRNLIVHILSREDTYEIPQLNPPHL